MKISYYKSPPHEWYGRDSKSDFILIEDDCGKVKIEGLKNLVLLHADLGLVSLLISGDKSVTKEDASWTECEFYELEMSKKKQGMKVYDILTITDTCGRISLWSSNMLDIIFRIQGAIEKVMDPKLEGTRKPKTYR